NYSIVGFSGYRFSSVKESENKKLSEDFEKQLDKLLFRYKRKETILVTHDVPYYTKMDKVKNEDSPKYGKHIGDEIIRKLEEKYQPLLHICGHMHESQGKGKLGRTLVVNPGYAREGEFAIIDLDGKNIDVKFHGLK
ncbi:MAG: metallophosphoesterase family protein, partial [archaeon]